MKRVFDYVVRSIFWGLSRLFVYAYIRQKFNIRKEDSFDPIPKPPFIMISNHGTFFDPWIVGHYSKYPISIMNNEDAFKAPWIVRWYLQNIGTFPKKKGASDFKAMKTTLKRLSLGYPVLIFPEGQTTWDGSTQVIYAGIEKIIKKAKVPCVIMRVRGNFLSKPWWADTFRKGIVRVSCRVIKPESIASMSEEELLNEMVTSLSHNDIEDKNNQQMRFTGENLAEGLHRFIWICKECRSEDTLVTQGDMLSCTHCNASWKVDSHFRLTREQKEEGESNLYEWALWHKKQVREKIASKKSTEQLSENIRVQYCTVNTNGSVNIVAEGKLTLTKKELFFVGVDKNQSFSLPVKEITDYVYQRKDTFECRRKNRSYRFRIIDHSPMKWVYYLRYLHGYEQLEQQGYQ